LSPAITAEPEPEATPPRC
jgi:hypothetical protein